MLLWILVGVVVVFYGVIAYFAARTWHVGHVILMVSVFLLTGLFFFLAAMTLKTQHEWRTLHDRLAKQLTDQESRLHQLTAVVDEFGNENPDSIPLVRQELGRALIHRGRVWRTTLPVAMAGQEITLNMQGWGDSACIQVGQEPEDEFAEEPLEEGVEGESPQPQATTPHGIAKGKILFAFAEFPADPKRAALLYGESDLPQRDTKGACRLPAVYLGRFEVTDAADQALKLTALSGFSESQLRVLQQKNLTWTLYEAMPKDDPRLFAGVKKDDLATLLRRPPTVPEPEWTRVLEEFAREGTPAEAADVEERQEVQVEFQQEATIEVDAAGQVVSFDRPFDPTGRAAAPALRQGTPTKFSKGQVASFPLPSARALAAAGTVTLTEEPPLYRRPRRDFALLLHDRDVALNSRRQEMAVTEGDTQSLRLATEKANEQIEARGKEILLLREDLAAFRDELKAAIEVVRTLAQDREAQRKQLSDLYRRIQGLRDAMGRNLLRQGIEVQVARHS